MKNLKIKKKKKTQSISGRDSHQPQWEQMDWSVTRFLRTVRMGSSDEEHKKGIQKMGMVVFQCYVKENKGDNTKDIMIKLNLWIVRL